MKLKHYIIAIGLGNFLATNVMMLWTFLIAYSSPDKSVIVYINRYGEATLELWLIIPMFIISVLSIYFIMKREVER